MSHQSQTNLRERLIAFKGERSVRVTARALRLDALKVSNILNCNGFPRAKDIDKLAPHLGTKQELSELWCSYHRARREAPKVNPPKATRYSTVDVCLAVGCLLKLFGPTAPMRPVMDDEQRAAYDAACRLGLQVFAE